MKILAVDDSKAVHAFMKILFKGTEHKLFSAFNGKEAVEFLESDESIDLILLDWEMPEMNGLETLKALREKGLSMPIIMVTSKNELSQITEALNSGANEYVMKPFTKEVLLDKFDLIAN